MEKYFSIFVMNIGFFIGGVLLLLIALLPISGVRKIRKFQKNETKQFMYPCWMLYIIAGAFLIPSITLFVMAFVSFE